MKILIFSLVVIAMIFSPPVRSNAVRASSVGHPQSRSAGQPPAAIPALQGSFGSPITFATHSDLQSYGFSFGPADGQFGAMPAGNGNYVFFGAAGSTAACGGTPSVKNGAFTFTGTLDHVTGGNGCKKLFGFGDGPSGWVFDTGYAGGGQVVRFSSGGRSGWLMPFHSEFQWQNPASADQKCGGVPCFYGSIGLAVSTDDAKTFQVVGQIVQPSQPLSAFMGGGRNMGTGYGTMVVADANGKHLDNPPTDPSDAYFYLFYTDLRPDAPGACAVRECLAVVRALSSDVAAAALSGDPHQVATVFHKYDGASPRPLDPARHERYPRRVGDVGDVRAALVR